MNVFMLPGANAVEVADKVKAEMAEISKGFPDGMSYDIPFDMTTYISESIHHVYRTLFEALILVILVVFLSLQNVRATLVPAIAVPISLIGTFGVMLIFGFSLNMMTLLGLILAIGIVVDDAIVVVENVDRIMSTEHLSPYEATKKGDGGDRKRPCGDVACALRRFCSGKFPFWNYGPIVQAVYGHDRCFRDNLHHCGADLKPCDVFQIPEAAR